MISCYFVKLSACCSCCEKLGEKSKEREMAWFCFKTHLTFANIFILRHTCVCVTVCIVGHMYQRSKGIAGCNLNVSNFMCQMLQTKGSRVGHCLQLK